MTRPDRNEGGSEEFPHGAKRSTATTEIATYLRVSTESQKDKNTIEVQRRAIIEHAARQGWHIAEEFADEGVSGTVPFEERPEGARLLASAPKRVLIYCPDRLGRDASDALLAMKDFTRRKIDVEFVSQSFDATPEGKFVFTIMMGVAELDRAMIRRRLHAGIVRNVAEGKLYKTSSAPYGYTYSKETKQLTVDETRAAVVRRIFRQALAGEGIYRIANALTAEQVPSPGTASTKRFSNTLGGAWHASSIRNILHAPTYKGEALYGSGNVPMACPEIVTAATFDKVQRLLAQRSSKGSRAARTYLASGILFCGICGLRMSGYTSMHGLAKYRCNRRGQHGTVETVRQQHEGFNWDLHADALDERIKTEVRKTMADPQRLAKHIEQRADEIADAYGERLGAATAAERALADVAAQETRVLDLAQTGVMEPGEARKRLTALAKERKALQRQARQAERGLADVRAVEAQLESFCGTLADLLTDDQLGIERDEETDLDAPARWREPRDDAEWSRIARAMYDRVEVTAEIGGKTALAYSGTVTTSTSGYKPG